MATRREDVGDHAVSVHNHPLAFVAIRDANRDVVQLSLSKLVMNVTECRNAVDDRVTDALLVREGTARDEDHPIRHGGVVAQIQHSDVQRILAR